MNIINAQSASVCSLVATESALQVAATNAENPQYNTEENVELAASKAAI